MEYDTFFAHMSNYLPNMLKTNQEFVDFVKQQKGDKALQYEMSDYVMMTLPDPRIDYYQSSNYYEIQRRVTGYANEIIEALGFFPVGMDMDVLSQMQLYSNAILMLGLIFDIIILLFVILSVLLIYSLLMIQVESKSFEFGVMRMVGLTKHGIINMIVL